MNKREFIKTAALAGTGAFLVSKTGFGFSGLASQTDQSEADEFLQYRLPYSFSALEPNIDAFTMEVHYSKHHAAYTKNFNTAVKAENLTGKPAREIFANVSKYPAAIRNNGGGWYNHNLYFEILSPNGGGEASGDIAARINRDFGSFGKFREEFSKAAATLFGSGWVWLIVKDGKLSITSTPNQDNTLMDISPVKGNPVFGMDIWEHAYYLKHQNRRAEYIDAFWNVADWKKIDTFFQRGGY